MVRIFNAYEALIGALAGLTCALLGLVFLAIVYDVLVRTLGFQPPYWVSAFTEYALLFMTMLAAPWLVRRKAHVFVHRPEEVLDRLDVGGDADEDQPAGDGRSHRAEPDLVLVEARGLVAVYARDRCAPSVETEGPEMVNALKTAPQPTRRPLARRSAYRWRRAAYSASRSRLSALAAAQSAQRVAPPKLGVGHLTRTPAARRAS